MNHRFKKTNEEFPMKKLLKIIFVSSLLGGCSAKYAKVPLEPYEKEEEKSVVFFHALADLCVNINVDGEDKGEVCEDKYVRTILEPGKHTFYAEPTAGTRAISFLSTGIVIRQKRTFGLKPNKIYTFATYYIQGSWTGKTIIKRDVKDSDYFLLPTIALDNDRESRYEIIEIELEESKEIYNSRYGNRLNQ